MIKINKFILIISPVILFCLTVTCCNQKTYGRKNIFSRLAGSWYLISRIEKTNTGTLVNEPTLGAAPISLLMYDTLGNMSVQIMKRNRNDTDTSKSLGHDSNNSSAYNGYDAYFGTYKIDTIKHQVTHYIRGTINQKDVGRELIRNYSISGDTLLLWFTTSNANLTVTKTLTWIRANGEINYR